MNVPLPAPGDTRVVLPDIHGNFSALRDLLGAAGVLDERGQRRPGFFVCQLGDLVHGGHDVTEADRVTLQLARAGLIDVLLAGNHELPFICSIPSAFAGVHRVGDRVEHPAAQRLLNRTMREGRYLAAYALDGWLITHAGFTPEHLFDDEGRPANPDLRAACRLDDPAARAQALAALINERFARRITHGRRDMVVDGISPWRGGRDEAGSVFWCDLRELLGDCERRGNPVAQIVGHTPREGRAPELFAVSGPLGDQPVFSIDLAGIDDGRIGCLVRAPGETDWTVVAIDRPVRPLGAPPRDRYQLRR